MSATHLTDRDGQAQARLLVQFANSTNLRALLGSFTAQAQAAEDALWQLLTLRLTDAATGEQLDTVGLLVGQSRDGRSDDIYRLWIRARQLLNHSDGTVQEILDIFGTLLPDAWLLRLTDDFPAAFRFLIERTVTDDEAVSLQNFLRSARGAGIATWLVFTPFDITAPSSDVDTSIFTLDVGLGLDLGRLADIVVV